MGQYLQSYKINTSAETTRFITQPRHEQTSHIIILSYCLYGSADQIYFHFQIKQVPEVYSKFFSKVLQ